MYGLSLCLCVSRLVSRGGRRGVARMEERRDTYIHMSGPNSAFEQCVHTYIYTYIAAAAT